MHKGILIPESHVKKIVNKTSIRKCKLDYHEIPMYPLE